MTVMWLGTFRWRLPYLSLSALACLALGSAASAEDLTFALEPKVKATTFSTGLLLAGTRLEFVAKAMKANETLLLQRCGEPCNSAKLIKSWRADEMATDTPTIVVIVEPGRYYFWIMRKLPNGEVGPLFGESSESVASSITIHYVSGTAVSVTTSSP